MKSALLAYIPVWHAGYSHFVNAGETEQGASAIWLIDIDWAQTLSPELDYLRKEIRVVSSREMASVLRSLFPSLSVEILDQDSLAILQAKQPNRLLVPNEDVSLLVAKQFFPNVKIERSPIFLRWDRSAVTKGVTPQIDQSIGLPELGQILQLSYQQAGNSTDWWRHIGAALIRDNQPILLAHNTQLPNPQESYLVGDARSLFHKGEWIELTSAIHAEAGIIAQAAKLGIPTDGLELLVTTFPCPVCAKSIAQSGIKRLYFCEGYAMFDGEAILKNAGVEIIKVAVDDKTIELADKGSLLVEYA